MTTGPRDGRVIFELSDRFSLICHAHDWLGKHQKSDFNHAGTVSTTSRAPQDPATAEPVVLKLRRQALPRLASRLYQCPGVYIWVLGWIRCAICPLRSPVRPNAPR